MRTEVLIRVINLKKWFAIRQSLFDRILKRQRLYLKAVDGVSFNIYRGEIFGLTGESGCGKTTLGRTMLGLTPPTEGDVMFTNIRIFSIKGKELKQLRKKMQILCQDPFASVDPRMQVYDIIAEPLRIHKIPVVKDKISEALEVVKLSPPSKFFEAYPHQLSGGQMQRVNIARALILNPDFQFLDEPVSMLDMSVRAEILNLLLDVRNDFGLTFFFVSHDLAVARYICDRIAVMYMGKIVEIAETEELVKNPTHPYTKALIEAVPVFEAKSRHMWRSPSLPVISSTFIAPSGCAFYAKCPIREQICASEEPQLVDIGNGHHVACKVMTQRSAKETMS